MEDEESDWSEGPTIEEILSDVAKRPSMFCKLFSSRQQRNSDSCSFRKEKSSSPDTEEELQHHKTSSLTTNTDRNTRTVARTSSSILGVLSTTSSSSLKSNEKVLPSDQEASKGLEVHHLHLPSGRMPRSLSTPVIRNRVSSKSLIKSDPVVSRFPDYKSVKQHQPESSHHVKVESLDKENHKPASIMLEQKHVMHPDQLQYSSRDLHWVKRNAKDDVYGRGNSPADIDIGKQSRHESVDSVPGNSRITETTTSHSSSVTEARLRAPDASRANVAAQIQSSRNGAVTTKPPSQTSSKGHNNLHSHPIGLDTEYESGNVSFRNHTTTRSHNGIAQIFQTHGNKQIIQHQHHLEQNPEPSASPSANQMLTKMDSITVNNHIYLRLDLLGKGGSSKVYEVLDLESRKVKALKVVDLEGLDKATLNSYKNEVEKLERLQWSDLVIKLYDYEYKDNQLLLVMEKGRDFASILKNIRGSRSSGKSCIEPIDLKFYWRGMLLSVQAIHNEGIIHSDLKPANFVSVSGMVKLIDFGIASSIQQDMTSVIKDSQAGTFNYMSPESLMDVKTGPLVNNLSAAAADKVSIKIGVKSDVWSLGCILYSLVYGKTPFQDIVVPLRKLAAISNPNHEIPFPDIDDKQLLDVLKKCLQFDPRKRPSIKQLLEHPYLTENTNTSNNSTPEKMPHVKSVIDELLAQLTPNSLNRIPSMIQQLKPTASSLSEN
ncbi:hypothetical protein SK128_001672 [Halocaridina rubra]|uniref:Protein kinase domain-containing protein n=1 Tax=Halocaridina rubra TaxID=373956 RepID=A0AAN9A3K9_HALRR